MSALGLYLGIGSLLGAFDLGYSIASGGKGPRLWWLAALVVCFWPGVLIYWLYKTRLNGRHH